MTPSVVIAGSVAQKAGQAGHTWQFLQYLLGFRRLGWDVLLVDRLEPGMYVDAAVNIRYLQRVLDGFGLGGDFSLLLAGGRSTVGLSRAAVLARTRRSALLVNVMGFLDDEEILAAAPLRVFLDTDPGFPQMWRDLGLHDAFAGHDAYVTIAERIGAADCTIPDCGLPWIRWRQPVVLEQWPATEPTPGGSFTSIGSWRGPYAPIEHDGRTYGLRVHEFRKFYALPGLTGASFEVALDIDRAEARDLEQLAAHGWRLADPETVAADPWVYRDWIRASAAEFMATKGIYVDTRSGWFSERSLCYLASGKPVLAQDTGLAELYPVGRGLLTFRTVDEAAAGVEAIRTDYAGHARAARALAEEVFDSDRVLGRLLDELGLAA